MVNFFEISKIFFKSTIHRSFGKIFREYDEKCFNVASLINFIVFIDATLKSLIAKLKQQNLVLMRYFIRFILMFLRDIRVIYTLIGLIWCTTICTFSINLPQKQSARHQIVTKTIQVWRAHINILRTSFPYTKVKSLVTRNMISFKMNLKLKMNTGKTTFFINQSKNLTLP